MLQYILLDTTIFGPGDSTSRARRDLVWIMEALVQRNQTYLRQHPSTPRLYRSGVKYTVPAQMDGEVKEVALLREALGAAAKKRDISRVLEMIQQVLGGERFRDIGRILENGGGDCDNLACWRAAELREEGIQARPCMTHRTSVMGNTIYHALVLWPPMAGVAIDSAGQPQPTSEDPSLLLGMSQPDRAADRAEEIRKNVERCDVMQGRSRSASPSLVSFNGGDLDDALSDVLGTRRRPRVDANAAVQDVERLLKGAA